MQQPCVTYNLLEKPCIPVVSETGRIETLNLRDMLVNSHQLRELSHGNPVVAASLLRLLVAILADIYSLPNYSSWGKVWKAGAFDRAAIETYFRDHADRFDLFHPHFPFYQCAVLEDDAPINLNLLACELSSGNNPTLFDHSTDTQERDYTPVEAFHLLLATQNIALAGLLRRTTRLRGESEPLYWQSAYGGAIVPGAMIWLTGDNLFETLALNLIPVEKEAGQDRPAWRLDGPEILRDRMEGKQKKVVPIRGIRDRLTFQSRLIRLLPVLSESGEIVVRRAAFNHGRSLDVAQSGFDPMLAYRASKREGYLVNRLSAERAAWRDVHALIGLDRASGGKFEAVKPEAMKLVAFGIEEELPGIDRTRRLRLNVAGLANDQAKILLWRHDRMDAPAAVLGDEEMGERIGNLLQDAEGVASDLRGATRRLCEIFLAPLTCDPAGKPVEGAMKADPDRVTALADSVDPRPAYWARLESAFHRLLLQLVGDADKASGDWKDRVQREARRAFGEAITRLGDSPQALKAASLVNTSFTVPSNRTAATSPAKGRRKQSKGETEQNVR